MSDTATMYRNMDVKTINIKIKYGATMEELLEYFNCSEEQFEGYVSFSTNFPSITSIWK